MEFNINNLIRDSINNGKVEGIKASISQVNSQSGVNWCVENKISNYAVPTKEAKLYLDISEKYVSLISAIKQVNVDSRFSKVIDNKYKLVIDITMITGSVHLEAVTERYTPAIKSNIEELITHEFFKRLSGEIAGG